MEVGLVAHECHGLSVGVVGRGHPARELVHAVAAPQEPAVGAPAVELAGRACAEAIIPYLSAAMSYMSSK